jgi:hypothetical protein
VIRFVESDEQAENNPILPDKMLWDDWEAGIQFGIPAYVTAAPPKDARRVDMRLRPAPEFPTDKPDAPIPTPPRR